MKEFSIKQFDNKRHIDITDDIMPQTVQTFNKDLNEILDKDNDVFEENYSNLMTLDKSVAEAYRKTVKFPPIYLDICCPGGSIYHGLSMYDTIKRINDEGKHEIIARISGYAASMATVIMLACKKRYGGKNSSYLVHSASTITCGKVQDLIDDVEELKRLSKILREIYLANTHLTEEDLDKVDTLKKDWWLNSKEALDFGLITQIE